MCKKKIGIEKEMNMCNCAQLVKTGSLFKSNIFLIKEKQKADAQSIIELLSLGVRKGEYVTVVTDGEDETQTMLKMENLLTGVK